MAKTNGIAQELVMEVLSNAPEGISIEDKAAWIKISGPHGDDGPRMYIARQVRIRQVDLSGFGKGFVGTVPLKAPNGRVQAHLDMEHEHALKHLGMLMQLLVSLPATPKPERKPLLPKRKKEEVASARMAKGLVDNSHLPKVDNSEEAKERRRRLIAQVAKEKGVPVSPNADI